MGKVSQHYETYLQNIYIIALCVAHFPIFLLHAGVINGEDSTTGEKPEMTIRHLYSERIR